MPQRAPASPATPKPGEAPWLCRRHPGRLRGSKWPSRTHYALHPPRRRWGTGRGGKKGCFTKTETFHSHRGPWHPPAWPGQNHTENQPETGGGSGRERQNRLWHTCHGSQHGHFSPRRHLGEKFPAQLAPTEGFQRERRKKKIATKIVTISHLRTLRWRNPQIPSLRRSRDSSRFCHVGQVGRRDDRNHRQRCPVPRRWRISAPGATRGGV